MSTGKITAEGENCSLAQNMSDLTPDMELARMVSAALNEAGLLNNEDQETFQTKFASGAIVKGDWQNMYENPSQKIKD